MRHPPVTRDNGACWEAANIRRGLPEIWRHLIWARHDAQSGKTFERNITRPVARFRLATACSMKYVKSALSYCCEHRGQSGCGSHSSVVVIVRFTCADFLTNLKIGWIHLVHRVLPWWEALPMEASFFCAGAVSTAMGKGATGGGSWRPSPRANLSRIHGEKHDTWGCGSVDGHPPVLRFASTKYYDTLF